MLRIDAALVAVTPSATDYLTMRPQDVCVLRLDDLSRVEGELAPSRLHLARPRDGGAVTPSGRAGTARAAGRLCALGQPLACEQAGARAHAGEQRLPDAQPRDPVLRCRQRRGNARARCAGAAHPGRVARTHRRARCEEPGARSDSLRPLGRRRRRCSLRSRSLHLKQSPHDHHHPERPSTSPIAAQADAATSAISEWPDVDQLYRRLAALVAQPMRPIRADAMATVMRWFDERCATSKRLAEQAKAVIPGGVQHNLAFNHPFSLAMAQAEGAWLTDVDGNRYIDFLQAGGPTLLGSNHPEVRRRVHAVIDECGPVTGLLHEYEIKLAELVCRHMPGVEMLRLLGSGTEAVMGAVRLARAHTGGKWIIKIGGAYHGWSDQLVYGMRLPRRDASKPSAFRAAPPATRRNACPMIWRSCAASCDGIGCAAGRRRCCWSRSAPRAARGR
ncbi:aminotransferase class-III domain-containing protein [Ditylenchus destructor]|nr:aminotransferase class-III domain-containing protein [Ditylenchus destructor]